MRDIAAVPDHEIELSGGALALDFANTVGGTHVRPTHDHLRGYADVLRFAVMAGGLKDDVAKRLAVRAEREPMRAAAVYELGIALREAVWAVFSSLASGEGPPVPGKKARRRETRLGGGRGGNPRQGGDDPFAVDLEDFFFVTAHQIDVELVNADRGELAELFDVLIDLPGHAKAVDRLVVNE